MDTSMTSRSVIVGDLEIGGYLWTDESFKSGENAAQKILDKL
jgi:hypothetical protein